MLILSNRLPLTVHRDGDALSFRPSAGGLVTALDPALQRHGGSWIGWLGLDATDGGATPDLSGLELGYDVLPVDLSTDEVDRYYHGFSNGTLWPLFHAFPERALFRQADWDAYEAVNERFARAAATAYAKHARDPDLVWIHDYQLMRAPQPLRDLCPNTRIGFFLHIPFPPYDVFRLLPWARQLLVGVLASDIVGFHVDNYARNFLDCVERLLALRVDHDAGLVEYGAHSVEVRAFPIGIDYDRFAGLAADAPADSRSDWPEHVVLGVDRLDYTKGIPERIAAFERLLELHPEHRGRVQLLQVAVPSRSKVGEYQELKREIDELVGRVNGRFATDRWSPIRYLYRAVPSDHLAALYRDAHVAMVTPLRDGMNLVAKEFVACQSAADDPGVLVLSRLAGAAETMHEALLVNPHDLDGTAEALHRALTMDESERRSRMLGLQRRERRHTVEVWTQRFIDAAIGPHAAIAPVADAEFDRWLGRFLGGHHLALFLDYDGTLTPLRGRPEDATLDPAVRDRLATLAARDDTDVTIVSGRALADVRAMVDLDVIGFAGNHGLQVGGGDLDDWRHGDLDHYADRLGELANALDAVCAEGAWVERKGASLTLHYRATPVDQHEAMLERARTTIVDAGFQARMAHRAIEARPPIGWDKGHAVLHVLRQRHGPGWSETVRPIYIGDDLTDEDAFRVLAGLGITFRVGPPIEDTLASRRLPDVSAVHALLRWLCSRANG